MPSVIVISGGDSLSSLKEITTVNITPTGNFVPWIFATILVSLKFEIKFFRPHGASFVKHQRMYPIH